MDFGGGGSLMDHVISSVTAWYTILLLKVKGEGRERKKIPLSIPVDIVVQYENRFISIFYSNVSVQFSLHFSLLPFSKDERQAWGWIASWPSQHLGQIILFWSFVIKIQVVPYKS